MTDRATYEKIAKLIGAKVDESIATGIHLNDDYMISIVMRLNNIWMTLVKVDDECPLNNKSVKRECIKFGASDRVIMNRYNKLISMI